MMSTPSTTPHTTPKNSRSPNVSLPRSPWLKLQIYSADLAHRHFRQLQHQLLHRHAHQLFRQQILLSRPTTLFIPQISQMKRRGMIYDPDQDPAQDLTVIMMIEIKTSTRHDCLPVNPLEAEEITCDVMVQTQILTQIQFQIKTQIRLLISDQDPDSDPAPDPI